MKFIIFIADNIRQGNFPRVDQFEYSHEYGLYTYLGRDLSVSEFNEASDRVFHPDFRNQGFCFRPQVVGSQEAELKKTAESVEKSKVDAAFVVTVNHVTVPVGKPVDPSSHVAPPKFRLEGKKIFVGQERVAGLYGEEKQLRVFKEELRDEIEAWLTAHTPPKP